MRAITAFFAGVILAASVGVTAAPLPFLSGKATITKITSAISTDPNKPTLTVEANVTDDGLLLGGTCVVTTANAQAAQQFVVGSVVKLVLGGK